MRPTIALLFVALLAGCATIQSDQPAKPRVKRDPKSICNPSNPYCETRRPTLNENGELVPGILAPASEHQNKHQP